VSAGRGVATAFEKAGAEGRGALVGYLPAGFPTYEGSIAAARTMVEAGCDVIEIGLPYSDPLMDGPTIQDAVHQALSGAYGSPTCSARSRRSPPPACRRS
jgi:tryptophan synthase alpha chain